MSATSPSIDEQWQVTSTANGSTGVRCKHFTTTQISSGTAITYTSNSTNGDSWTINEEGVYAISITGDCSGSDIVGVSELGQNCTTSAPFASNSNTFLCYGLCGPSLPGGCSWTGPLHTGNVLHFHQAGAASGNGHSAFHILRIQ